MSNCTQCHEVGKGPSREKCLACHTSLQERIEQGRGYHGRMPLGQVQGCPTCHSEHAGREFELVHWPEGEKGFDHALTGFPLRGRHAKLDCRKCHNETLMDKNLKGSDLDRRRTYLGMPGDCLGCHFDEHRKQLGTNCVACHNEEQWKPAPVFDHTRTQYPLTGKHAAVKCASCHAQKADRSGSDTSYVQYKDLKFQACTDCHKDPHQNRLGPNCTQCHGTDGWRTTAQKSVDHDKTDFPLRGKHVTVACDKCHKSKDILAKIPHAACTECHKDPHANRLGPNCTQCHTTDGWRILVEKSFDHSKTDFPLRGRHVSTPCEKCHTSGTRSARIPHALCANCHADVHRGQFAARPDSGRCEGCHTEQSFTPARFTVKDHAATKFPLEGAHLAQSCLICHESTLTDAKGKYRRYRFENRTCLACHNDVHAGQFTLTDPPRECTHCHGVEQWRLPEFDHNSHTTYKLEGAHKTVPCLKCHKSEQIKGQTVVVYRETPRKCEHCHGGVRPAGEVGQEG